ncbi:hypothetical protein CL644_01175 [bacterium]|nr:hypothetical protein [bacterium]|tara:strand:+ start:8471 stop:11578 length:3108 start_codon:yes stop_codon:yes gene_type:complete
MTNATDNNLYSKRGSEWSKWDMHVHTPESDGYSGTWEEFKTQLKDADCAVVGINDYFSVAGYKKLKEEINNNTLDLEDKIILPVVEMRMTDSLQNRNTETNGTTHFNFHIVFSDKLDVDDIESFIKSLESGDSIIGADYSDKTKLKNKKVSFKETLKKLKSDKKFEDNFLIWLPYDEYGGIGEIDPASDGWIKEDFIKKSHILGSSNQNQKDFFLWKSELKTDGTPKFSQEQFKKWFEYKKPCIKGSDSHSHDYPIGKLKDKDSNPLEKFCWIKADPTFEGLRQIIFEPEARVFIGEKPEVKDRVEKSPTKYIESINIDQNNGYDEKKYGEWFKEENIVLNKELIAIIGNKGSGKSALTDIIGLLGNSHNKIHGGDELFSFLNKEKFLKNNIANNFHAQLNWQSGDFEKKYLNENTDTSIDEKVEYLPQKYLERICSNIDDDDFRQKLNEVIFGYVEDKDKHSKNTLDELLSYLTSESDKDVSSLKEKLHTKNEEIVSIEKKLTESYLKKIEDNIKNKNEEIVAHDRIKPREVEKVTQNEDVTKETQEKIEAVDKNIQDVESKIQKLKEELVSITYAVEKLNQAKRSIERHGVEASEIEKEFGPLFTENDLVFSDVLEIKIDTKKIDKIVLSKEKRIEEINTLLSDPIKDIAKNPLSTESTQSPISQDNLHHQLATFKNDKKAIIDAMAKPEKAYQEYLKKKKDWDDKKKELEGDEASPLNGTLSWLIKEKDSIADSYKENLKSVREERVTLIKEIFNKKKSFIELYNKIKASIDKEIAKHNEDLDEYNISIEAGMQFDKSFYQEFFAFINQGVKGSFYEKIAGLERLQKIISEVEDWNNVEQIVNLLSKIEEHIDKDSREEISDKDRQKDVFGQMKQGKDPVEFYDYLFSLDYVKTKYDLKVDEKDLSELSPGERGGLLLIFYLMLDLRDIPLIIDQPEDNLDNESVYQILVTFLKKAKKRRQIIIVTHNPNLAIVADAEQIIYVSIDKKDRKNDYSFYSGAIENPEINKKSVDILEGTLPAFDNRRLKYRKHA